MGFSLNKYMKYGLVPLSLTFLLFSPVFTSGMSSPIDFDPLVDLTCTIEILKIRSLEHDDPQLDVREVIDETSDPDFYITLIIDENVYTSPIYWNTRYVYHPDFSVLYDIPDDHETLSITIQLWDAADTNSEQDRLCDISRDTGDADDAYDVELRYDVRQGMWTGDDALQDSSGYGRVNGCDDGTIYIPDRDCELWFSITQHDADLDGIPYYVETTIYGSDPALNDAETDPDEDGVATWWEWKYGYDPYTYEDHATLDPEVDGIYNINEYKTAQWFSDPFTRDLFLELDQMCEGPACGESRFPQMAKEMLYTAHDRQNVIYHLDDGSWGEDSGSEYVAFDPVTDWDELREIYDDYFLHGDEDNWRKEIFHYGVVIYESSFVEGNAFGSNRFQISARLLDQKVEDHGFDRDVTYASAYMHETGHTLGFWPIPGHSDKGWLLRIFLPLYKSCMSYGWIYRMVDYSDGSRPFLGPRIGDYDDWERMDLTYFHRGW
jgi:hypothetical protein